MNDPTAGISTFPRRQPSDRAYVSLSETLTWIAFRNALGTTELHTVIELEKGPFANKDHGLSLLETALLELHDATAKGALQVRAFFAPGYFIDEARRNSAEKLTADKLATFRQFDVRTGGLQRQPIGYPAIMLTDQEFSRAFKGRADDAFTDGYLEVEVERAGLMKRFPNQADVPRNRQLDHEWIRERARSLKLKQPSLSKGSAAASIADELDRNPRTGKLRDARNLERIIAALWGAGSQESPP